MEKHTQQLLVLKISLTHTHSHLIYHTYKHIAPTLLSKKVHKPKNPRETNRIRNLERKDFFGELFSPKNP